MTTHGGPSVTIVSNHPSSRGGGSRPPSSHSPKSQGLYVWMVMSLLVSSTTLAVYDLYVLATAFTAGA